MKPPPGAPWVPPEYDNADVGAIQAMARGDASPEQQRRALTYIVESICKTYDLSFNPDSERATAFAEGKRFCGNQIVKMTKINIAALRKKDGRRASSRTGSREQPAARASD